MHQCLSCGNIIPDEMAVEVLRGCKQCKGTRYYYTTEPLTETQRQDLLRKAQQDMSQVVAEVLQREAPEASAGVDWTELKPRDLRRLVKEVQQRRAPAAVPPAAPAAGSGPASPVHAAAKRAPSTRPALGDAPAGGWEYEDAKPLGIDTSASRKEVAETLEAQAKAPAKPDTVHVGDGSYEIDVKALLEHNPIVVHKDGSYLIHLPSLFGQAEKD